MTFLATKSEVFNRGVPSDEFLTELVLWGKTAPESLFAVNYEPHDTMNELRATLGPWLDIRHRLCAMLECLRVLGGVESSWNWNEGVDTSNPSSDTPETMEAGLWQVSWNSRNAGQDLRDYAYERNVRDGHQFQSLTKADHEFAMTWIVMLLRHTWKENGPLYKDRSIFKGHLQDATQSVYPWLSRDAVTEFEQLLTA